MGVGALQPDITHTKSVFGSNFLKKLHVSYTGIVFWN